MLFLVPDGVELYYPKNYYYQLLSEHALLGFRRLKEMIIHIVPEVDTLICKPTVLIYHSRKRWRDINELKPEILPSVI
jgi:hypothetical protein